MQPRRKKRYNCFPSSINTCIIRYASHLCIVQHRCRSGESAQLVLGNGVRIMNMAIIFICSIYLLCITYSIIKGQFLSCHAYVVWDVKDTVVGVMEMGNIVPRAGLELTYLASHGLMVPVWHH